MNNSNDKPICNICKKEPALYLLNTLCKACVKVAADNLAGRKIKRKNPG